MKISLFFLTCANKKEADLISGSLLKKRLIVCAKKMPVSSSFFWKGSINKANEMLLIMESVESDFKAIEREIRKLHSYETFTLFALPVNKVSSGVVKWMKDGLKFDNSNHRTRR
jgi:periplasmic divalent cation tolerance protein